MPKPNNLNAAQVRIAMHLHEEGKHETVDDALREWAQDGRAALFRLLVENKLVELAELALRIEVARATIDNRLSDTVDDDINSTGS